MPRSSRLCEIVGLMPSDAMRSNLLRHWKGLTAFLRERVRAGLAHARR
ncbi:MAG TPA: hypothetical protein VFC15_19510 [Candidatus Limnocylindrales bacterium]|nr:hypothetical protein [Candidatus Limnocylindrales bacterium]